MDLVGREEEGKYIISTAHDAARNTFFPSGFRVVQVHSFVFFVNPFLPLLSPSFSFVKITLFHIILLERLDASISLSLSYTPDTQNIFQRILFLSFFKKHKSKKILH